MMVRYGPGTKIMARGADHYRPEREQSYLRVAINGVFLNSVNFWVKIYPSHFGESTFACLLLISVSFMKDAVL